MAQKRLKINSIATKKRNSKSKSKSKAEESKQSQPNNNNTSRGRGGSAIKITTPIGAINTRTNSHDYKTGQYVRLTDLRQGYIRYVGQTAFSKHILYGIELDHKYEGKHSGMYKGVKYFDCSAPNKGIFVTINKIAAPVGAPKNRFARGDSNHLLGGGGGKRNKHGRKLSAMIYRNQSNKSRVSFIVPDIGSLLLSPTPQSDNEDDDNKSENDVNSPGFSTILAAYSSEMMGDIREEQEEKYENENDSKQRESHVVQLILTPTGATDITAALKNKIKRIKKKTKGKKHAIGVRIPFGKLNSKCMSIVLSFLTMKELSEYAFVSQSARDSIRLVALYDFRYMLYDALSIQSVRKILCILKFHKPKELILPMAYFIYDPVVLRLFLQFFNVGIAKKGQFLYKYIHKLVIDDRDIRPNSWLMRPGNYPWNELCNVDNYNASETVFPFELVECFQSLANNLWVLDIRYTLNVELSYFMKSVASILYLSVSAENRMDMEQFYNVTHLSIQNKIVTWEEIERTELLEWKVSFKQLIELTIINQRFEASCLDLLSAISWLPRIKKYVMSNCHFNEPSNFESIRHMRDKTKLNNRLHTFEIKRHSLNRTIFAIISQFFHRINKLFIIDCKLSNKNKKNKKNKTNQLDFSFFKSMTHLTNIRIVNLKSKKRLKNISYKEWLLSVYEKIIKYVYVSPVIVECNLIRSQIKIQSHIACKYCKQLIAKKYLTDHLNLICGERSIECPLCGGKVKRKSLTYHWQNNCREYYIQCFLCPKLFNVKTRHLFHTHVLRHSMDLDEESGKYELVFQANKQAVELANQYPIYTISICKTCQHRCIGPVVPAKYRHKLIPNECESCTTTTTAVHDEKAKTKSRRISVMKKNKGKKVLIHPFPKHVKLKSIKPIK